MAREADVVVVGAGPAGLNAAIRASKAGAKVLVVDRKKTIGAPVHCGEGTFARILKPLDMEEGRWVVNRPENMLLHPPNGKEFNIDISSLNVIILDRVLFEQEMAKRAEELGTEFILEKTVVGLGGGGVKAGGTTGGVKAGGEVEGVKVGGVAVDGGERMGGGVALDDGEKITSHLVIGCDGIESGIGRLSGLTKPLPLEDMGSAAQYRMEGDIWIEDTVDVFVGDKIAPGGYAWVFPKRGKLANVGAGVMGVGGHPPALTLLRRFVEERYPDARIVDTMAGCVPVGPPIDTAVKDNVMLAGDAARHAYAIAGGGIHSALWAGAMAGDAAGLFAQDKQRVHIREYDENWKAFMHKNLKKSYARKAKMYSSEKAMSRFMSGLKFAAPLIKYLPIDPLRLWWGKHDVS